MASEDGDGEQIEPDDQLRVRELTKFFYRIMTKIHARMSKFAPKLYFLFSLKFRPKKVRGYFLG